MRYGIHQSENHWYWMFDDTWSNILAWCLELCLIGAFICHGLVVAHYLGWIN
jgi:hypothetical protein